jgi:adenylate cyclase
VRSLPVPKHRCLHLPECCAPRPGESQQYGIYIQCAADTLRLAGPDAFEWRCIDRVRLAGKTVLVDTVEIMADKGPLSETQVFMRERYHQGLALYPQQKWEEAMAKFAESDKLEERFPARPTTPSRVSLERCALFKDHPPVPDWDGTWMLASKKSTEHNRWNIALRCWPATGSARK